MPLFPEKFDYYPSEKEGLARMIGFAVLLSSGKGDVAEAAATVTYSKLILAEEVLKELVVRTVSMV